MAHYACDCWDAEILMSSGWVECVGIADRSAYDLQVHAKATKTDLVAREVYPEPRDELVLSTKFNRQLMGKAFKQDNAAATAALETLSESISNAMEFQAKLDADGSAPLSLGEGSDKVVTITKEMVTFTSEMKKVLERKYVPNVIEPSFGIGRILTGVLEHSFSTREGDEQRGVLSFRSRIAPFKAVLLLLDGRLPRKPLLDISALLVSSGISNTTDDSGASIGKRYSRADEIGIPFAVTYDVESANDSSVTVRERDSCAQIRVKISELPNLLKSLSEETYSWEEAMNDYPVVTTGEDKAATAVVSKLAGSN